jgi:hypothetical protein
MRRPRQHKVHDQKTVVGHLGMGVHLKPAGNLDGRCGGRDMSGGVERVVDICRSIQVVECLS